MYCRACTQLHPPLADVPTAVPCTKPKGTSLHAHSVNRVMGSRAEVGERISCAAKIGAWYGQTELGDNTAVLAGTTCRERSLSKISSTFSALAANQL